MEFVEYSVESLRADSVRLAELVEADGYVPDCVAYLAKGGWIIGEAVAEYFGAPLVELSAHRSGEAAKAGMAPLLAALPRNLRKALRERELRSRLANLSGGEQEKTMRVTERYPLPDPPARILLVDDAADTGSSVRSALRLLAAVWPDAEAKAAVINSFDKGRASVGWSLMRDTLISTPSSKDNPGYGRFLADYSFTAPNSSIKETD